MKVKMKIWISGTRNGEPWPAPGQVVDLPDTEGAKLCAQGSATPVVEDKVEKAVVDDAEARTAAPAEATKTGPGRRRS